MFKASIKRAFSLIMVLQAVFICLCIILAVHIFYQRYTELVYTQAETVLGLYTVSVENTLHMVEKGSYNILSDSSLQTQLTALQESSTQYDSYTARQRAERILANYLFSIDQGESICFISNKGEQLKGSYQLYLKDFPQETVRRFTQLAQTRDGGAVWTYDAEEQKIYLIRAIKETQSGKFHNLGILIITCPMEKIVRYDFPPEEKYRPLVILSEEGTNITTNAGIPDGTFPVPDPQQKTQYRFSEINGIQYYCTGKQSAYAGWTYTCYIPTSDMLHDVNSLRGQIFFALFAALALSLLFSSKLSSSVTRGIERLSKKMDGVRKGNYSFEPESSRFAITEIAGLNCNFEYMADEINYLINDVYRKQLMIQDMRYKILQNQINPHFIYNTLETVNAIAKQNSEEDISLIVQSLSKMLRGSLSSNDVLFMEEELALLQSFISIQKIRFEERLDFQLECKGDFSQVRIPKLTLQPLVENCINYGLERCSKTCRIRVKIGKGDGTVEIVISDNGPGMPQETIDGIFEGKIIPRRTGLGVKNVNERIKYTFGEEYGLQFKSELGRGTEVYITIPDEKSKEKGESGNEL